MATRSRSRSRSMRARRLSALSFLVWDVVCAALAGGVVGFVLLVFVLALVHRSAGPVGLAVVSVAGAVAGGLWRFLVAPLPRFHHRAGRIRPRAVLLAVVAGLALWASTSHTSPHAPTPTPRPAEEVTR
jgi:hypothetical protein